MNTLIANRTPSRSCLANEGHLTIASRSPWRAASRTPGWAWTVHPYRDRAAAGNEGSASRRAGGRVGKELPRGLEETRVGDCARQLLPHRIRSCGSVREVLGRRTGDPGGVVGRARELAGAGALLAEQECLPSLLIRPFGSCSLQE